MNKCSSCGAPIVWCVTEQGKRMPVDALPSESGNVVIKDGKARVIVRWLAREHGELAPTYTSHFATCPNADRHRKPRA